MLLHRIEEVALNAWPAIQQMLYDGWLLRFSNGYTKRANSVNVLYPGVLNLEEKIVHCETMYAARNLPPVFRITSLNAPPELDPALEHRGYQRVAPTRVLYLTMRQRLKPPVAPATLREEQSLPDWIALFYDLRGTPRSDQHTHYHILAAIPGRRYLATLRDEADAVVACGVAVIEGEYVGLFDLITDPARRGHGYGSALVAGLLDWAESNGAKHAYLQVESDNIPARHVYESKFGFVMSFTYWYRVWRNRIQS